MGITIHVEFANGEKEIHPLPPEGEVFFAQNVEGKSPIQLVTVWNLPDKEEE